MVNIAHHSVTLAFRHTMMVAVGFWAVSLLLATLEATLGANIVIGGLYFLSIPVLVACLTWANGGFDARRVRGAGAVLMLGTVVLLSSSFIILFGLLAASGLLHLVHNAPAGA